MKILWFEPLCLGIVFLFLCHRGFVLIIGVWPLGIVKNDIVVYRFLNFIFRSVLCTIQLFSLHWRKERFHYRIVVWCMRTRKWLNNIERFQIGAKSVWTIICSSVGMEYKILRWMSGFSVGCLVSYACRKVLLTNCVLFLKEILYAMIVLANKSMTAQI